MTTPMRTPEHTDAARQFHAEAATTFAAGRDLHGAELLWGAVAHAPIAAAQLRGLPHEHHRDSRRVAWRVKEETGDADIWKGFKAGEQLHIYFYHRRMYAYYNLTTARHDADYCVDRLLSLIG